MPAVLIGRNDALDCAPCAATRIAGIVRDAHELGAARHARLFAKDQLRALKWRNWKMHILWETEPNTGVTHLEVPYLFNVVQDPKEETDVNSTQGWVRGPMRKMQAAFQESLAKHPRVPPGAPDDWVPVAK